MVSKFELEVATLRRMKRYEVGNNEQLFWLMCVFVSFETNRR